MRYLAKRFAGKEAFSKALGLGLRGPMTLLSLQILNDRRGKPYAVARKALAPYLRRARASTAHVSLSDEQGSALAFVILEKTAEWPLGSRGCRGAMPLGPGRSPTSPASS